MKWKFVSALIRADLQRYGYAKIRVWSCIRHPKLRYLIALRIASVTSAYTFWGLLSRFFYRHYSFKLGYQISIHARIGKGLYIGHWGPLIVHPKAIIGEFCCMTQGVVIGQANRGKYKGAPVIGNRVWIGANAVIVGRIRIGDDVLIAPNSFVNRDVPDHSVVTGNPAKIIPRENATEGYIG